MVLLAAVSAARTGLREKDWVLDRSRTPPALTGQLEELGRVGELGHEVKTSEDSSWTTSVSGGASRALRALFRSSAVMLENFFSCNGLPLMRNISRLSMRPILSSRTLMLLPVRSTFLTFFRSVKPSGMLEMLL